MRKGLIFKTFRPKRGGYSSVTPGKKQRQSFYFAPSLDNLMFIKRNIAVVCDGRFAGVVGVGGDGHRQHG